MNFPTEKWKAVVIINFFQDTLALSFSICFWFPNFPVIHATYPCCLFSLSSSLSPSFSKIANTVTEMSLAFKRARSSFEVDQAKSILASSNVIVWTAPSLHYR